MNVQIEKVSDKWDESIRLFPGRSFFDSGRWLDLFAGRVDEVHRLVFRLDGKKVIAGISCGIVFDNDMILLQSPFAASFGGFVFREGASALEMDSVVGAFVGYARALAHAQACRIDIVQRPSHLSGNPQFDLEEFMLLRHGFVMVDAQLEYYVETDRVQMSQTLRNEVRKGRRGSSFQKATIDEFIKFRQLVVDQQGKTKTVSDEDLRVSSANFPDNIHVFKLVGGKGTMAMLLSDQLSDHYAVGRNWFQDDRFKRSGATAVLVAEWIDHLAATGVPIASFGASARLTKEMLPGFIFFKERFKPAVALRRTFRFDHACCSSEPKVGRLDDQ
jgi:hypothetical protein